MPDHNYSTGVFIRHPAGDLSFVHRATRSLDKIAQTGAGVVLLTAIQVNFNARGNRVVIRSGAASLCRGGGNANRTLLAQQILDGGTAAGVGAEINACLTAAGQAGNHAWLATRINNTPIYNIQGAVSVAPSNLGITPADVSNWINNNTWPTVAAGAVPINDLSRAVLTALWIGAKHRPGNGTSALVEWNTNSASITLTTGTVMRRSKSISLAHELVHACRDGQGLQVGIDNGHATTALYEYMCVGLGIWANEPFSENQIRSDWHQVVKNSFFNNRLKVRYSPVAARPAY